MRISLQGTINKTILRQLSSLSRYSIVTSEDGSVVIGNTDNMEEVVLGKQIGLGATSLNPAAQLCVDLGVGVGAGGVVDVVVGVCVSVSVVLAVGVGAHVRVRVGLRVGGWRWVRHCCDTRGVSHA